MRSVLTLATLLLVKHPIGNEKTDSRSLLIELSAQVIRGQKHE